MSDIESKQPATDSVMQHGHHKTPGRTEIDQLIALFNSGNLLELERQAQIMINHYPDSGFAWKALGAALLTQGKNALPAMQKATALLPEDADAHYNLGNALRDSGRLDEALASYLSALKIKPDLAYAYYGMGNVLKELNRLSEAVTSYRSALNIDAGLATAHNNLGVALQEQGLFDEAASHYRSALKIDPGFATAHNNLGIALQELGQLDQAMASYRCALNCQPDLASAHYNLANALRDLGQLDQAVASYLQALEIDSEYVDALSNLALLYNMQANPTLALKCIQRCLALKETEGAKNIFASCVKRLRSTQGIPGIRENMIRALTEHWGLPGELAQLSIHLVKLNPGIHASSWPVQPEKFEALAEDPLLCALLCSAPICDMEIEQFMTLARRAMLNTVNEPVTPKLNLKFYCALARQCFINEYVYALSDDEIHQMNALRVSLTAALEANALLPLQQVVCAASYFPLYTLPFAATLLNMDWPEAVMALLVQQVQEPLIEQQSISTIPRLTGIEDDVSLLVQRQYEENAYPRWIKAAPAAAAKNLNVYLTRKFPLSPFKCDYKAEPIDILIAGCGTGHHSIQTAQQIRGAKVLAVDLSISSLAYAKRKTQELGLNSIEYAQADLLQLGSLGRDFDVIESSGVLHHLANPFAGWHALLLLLRPGGFMKLGLYSAIARRNVVKAIKTIKDWGYGVTASDIRQCRQQLVTLEALDSFGNTFKSSDFFSMSACRDLLFHVQEHRLTLSDIAVFLEENGLTLLGFEIGDEVLYAYRQRFPEDRAATNLDYWQTFEYENPDTFFGMYQFWIQKMR